MNLASIRIITEDVRTLIDFYEHVTGTTAIQYTDDFAELKTNSATLAIGSTKTLRFFGGEAVARASHNRTAIIEFKVDDVDHMYTNLGDFLQKYIVQQPTLMPWGNKSLMFRDPDGNLVNFFSTVTRKSTKEIYAMDDIKHILLP